MAFAAVCRTSQIIRNLQFTREIISSPCLLIKNIQNVKNVQCSVFLRSFVRSFNDDKKIQPKGKLSDPNIAQKPKVKKSLTSPQITLIMPDEKVATETLEDAEKIAKRRNLKLVKIIDFDTKTERPLYKLMTNLQYFEEEAKYKEQKRKEKQSTFKEDKLFMMSSKISEHDLYVKINQMIKLLKKQHEIRVYISQDGNPSRAEKLADIIKEELKDDGVVQKEFKKFATLKLFFYPKEEKKTESNNDKNETSSENASEIDGKETSMKG